MSLRLAKTPPIGKHARAIASDAAWALFDLKDESEMEDWDEDLRLEVSRLADSMLALKHRIDNS